METKKHYKVSIPHRYDSHTSYLTEIVREIRVFQSLTGTIHTKIEPGRIYRTRSFQSLTGSIHTKFKPSVYEDAI